MLLVRSLSGNAFIRTLAADCILRSVNHSLEPCTPGLLDLCIPGRNGRRQKGMFERYTEKARRVIFFTFLCKAHYWTEDLLHAYVCARVPRELKIFSAFV